MEFQHQSRRLQIGIVLGFRVEDLTEAGGSVMIPSSIWVLLFVAVIIVAPFVVRRANRLDEADAKLAKMRRVSEASMRNRAVDRRAS